MKKTLCFGVLCLASIVSLPVHSEGRSLTKTEKNKVISLVKGGLKDPDSARFQLGAFLPNKDNAYCGLVNAKNSLGGYAGSTPFLVTIVKPIGGYDVSSLIAIGGDDSSNYAVTTQCSSYGYGL